MILHKHGFPIYSSFDTSSSVKSPIHVSKLNDDILQMESRPDGPKHRHRPLPLSQTGTRWVGMENSSMNCPIATHTKLMNTNNGKLLLSIHPSIHPRRVVVVDLPTFIPIELQPRAVLPCTPCNTQQHLIHEHLDLVNYKVCPRFKNLHGGYKSYPLLIHISHKHKAPPGHLEHKSEKYSLYS